ncbi:MAG: PHP domain-containing protein, partial [Pseudomonadales bacterium]|nr:PHP domain-containing protein [Pseudomonadales bacterium]
MAPGSRAIVFPDTAAYKTLVVDLHTHSVFSDGHVWPTVRVAEAERDGLDAFAVTEHLEYQPHITDIPHRDRNRSFEEANRAAANLDLMVIPGVEITRVDDPGHMNAVFVTDANPPVTHPRTSPAPAAHLFPPP